MSNALIGFSGFVGSTLLKQCEFKYLYRSTNIQKIEGNSFDTIVCAGAPAQKWIANREPEADLAIINTLIGHLKTVSCKTFILISTVDVFKDPQGVDEDSEIEEEGLHAYGLHRRYLEQFVESHFEKYLIVRLPGLVGPGLRKNIIFDFLNDNNLDAIDSRGVFQFYPLVNLWFDIQTALNAKLNLVHLTAEPVSVASIASNGFGKAFNLVKEGVAGNYNMRTKFSKIFATDDGYQYSARETIQAVRAYNQSEPKTQNPQGETK